MYTKSLLALSLLVTTAAAHGPAPEKVPLTRLIKNLTDSIAKGAKDPDAFYRLGRVHYFAFTSPREPQRDGSSPDGDMFVYGASSATFSFNTWFGEADPGKNNAAGPSYYTRTDIKQVEHVREAVKNLSTALTLPATPPPHTYSYSAQPGLVELCLACALEDGAPWAKKVGPVGTLKPVSKDWTKAALTRYLNAYRAAVTKDVSGGGGRFGKFVSQEAGMSAKRLMLASGKRDTKLIAEIDKNVAIMEKMPRAITPIVFSLTPGRSLSDLVESRPVRFDLQATGEMNLRTWVRPDTAVLCWDPEQKGSIRSGAQLFGSSTWWMFWKDGFEALAALDDNRDGWVRGKELRGLAIWMDANQNGVSDKGEVIPVHKTEIDALATRWTQEVTGGYAQPHGVLLKNGEWLASYDWITLDR